MDTVAEYSQAYYGMCLVQGKGVFQNVARGWSLVRSSVQAIRDSGWFGQRYQSDIRFTVTSAVLANPYF